MTTPVKPPMGDRPLQSPEELSEVTQTQERLIDVSKVTENANATAAGSTSSAKSTAIEDVITGLRAGSMDVDRAVAMLMDRAIEQSISTGSPTVTRTELESIFRSALGQDPALVGLVKNLRSCSS